MNPKISCHHSANQFPKFYFLIGLVTLYLFTSVSLNAGENQNPDRTVIIGKIQYTDNVSPDNMEISLVDNKKSPSTITEFLSHTGSESIFTLELKNNEPVVLNISGEKGTGRVFLQPEKITDTLYIDYPVVETIVFLHTNDHHFDINMLDELESKIKEIRNEYEDVFLFDAGDIFVRHPQRWVVNGTLMEDPQWYGDRAIQMVQVMNDLGYQAMTLGNHELDYKDFYTLHALEKANFPLLSANMDITTDKIPPTKSYISFQTSTARKVNVLGLSVASGNPPGIRQKNIFDTAQEYMYLREVSDIFLALTHIGLENDARLAEKFPELDVIIGGHSHHLIDEGVFVNDVLIAQAGGNRHEVSDDHLVYLGKVIVKLENGIISHKSGIVMFIPE